jgi:putative salt-induced outer membrane protein YdiY
MEMNKSSRALPVILLLFSASAFADQVTLKNGDRVTGEIIKKDGEKLTIKSAAMGTITMPWAEVSAVTSDTPLTVVLPSGPVQGKVATADGKLQLQGRREPVPLSDIVAVRNAAEQSAYERRLHPGWGQLWAGTASLGLAGTAGNARTMTFTTGVNAARVTRTDKISLYFNVIKASALVDGHSADTAQSVRGGIGYDRNITSRLFANIFNDYEYDRFQNLDLRFVLGGGLGFHAIKTERSQLDLLAGVDFNHSKFSTPLTRNAAEVFGGDDYSLKFTGSTSLVQGFRIFDDLGDTGSYRVNFDVGAATRVSKWLTWNVSLSDRYLSHPAPGRKTNDFIYTTGLGMTFAR